MHVGKMIGFAVLLGTTIQMAHPASGRGFCNADHVGDEEQRSVVQEAAAGFYEGMGHAMLMLGAFERRDFESLQSEATSAETAFAGAANSYRDAAEVYFEVPWASVDPSTVAVMARATPTGVFNEVVDLSSEGPVELLSACGDKADEMAMATAKFVAIDDDPGTETFSEYLATISFAFYFGRIVSAAFAVSGGERPDSP